MRYVLLGATALLIGVLGCETTKESVKVNRSIVRSLNDAAIRNAVIRQQTLYPYHFEPNSTDLNELGRRELSVLTDYYRRQPGVLNIRQGDTYQHLYEGRVSTVRDMLAGAGVDVVRMAFQDGMPGGDNRVAHEVIAISKDRNNPSQPMYTEQRSGGTSGIGAARSGGAISSR